MMKNLIRYDGKIIRLKDVLGNTFEGEVEYLSPDYSFHEFGRDEEGLQMSCYVFFEQDIQGIKEISSFSAPFGYLEEEVSQDMDLIEEVFESENPIFIERLLNCLETLPKDEKIISILQKTIPLFPCIELQEKGNQLIEKWTRKE